MKADVVKAGGEVAARAGSISIDTGAARHVGQRRRCRFGSCIIDGGFVEQFYRFVSLPLPIGSK